MASSTEVTAQARTGATEDALLAASHRELDALFRGSPAGPVPTGVLDGTALLLPGGPAAAALIQALVWQGKVVDPGGTSLRNRITPLGIRAVTARVRHDECLVDGRPCVVFDYSRTSLVARGVRDEVRLFAPGLYLGVVWLVGHRVGWFALRERQPGTGSPPSPADRWFARLAVAVDDRRWDRFSTWVGIALIKGIRDNMRQHNLFDTNDSDRAEVYTPEGMRWIDDNDMSSVPTRHHPDLAPVLRNVDNAFAPWPLPAGAGAPPAQVR
jgi:hypothetical protein